MDNIIYESISFYNSEDSNNPLLTGNIVIDKNSFCKGIVKRDNSENLIMGIFKPNENLVLYEIMPNNEVICYKAKKGFLKYTGVYNVLDDDQYNEFYITVRRLNPDPRDYYQDNPVNNFIDYLNKYQKTYLKEERMQIYNSIEDEIGISEDGKVK